jgi:hypothetical protein
MSMSRTSALWILAALLAALPLQCQEPTGPVTPPPKFEVKKVPLHPTPPPPPLPVEQIIQRFAANEDAYRRAYLGYSLQQTVRVQEFAEDSRNASGEFQITGEIYQKPDGKRYERILRQDHSSLRRAVFTVEDVETLADLPLFFLATDQLGHYDLSYEGTEKLDELDTYIIRVKPKQPERGQRLFEGVVWVYDADLAIVKSYGRFVIATQAESPTLPFTLYETYREFIDGKYWFPTYTRSDDQVPSGKEQIPIRLTIRSTDFKLLPAGAAPAAGPAKHNPAAPADR